MINREGENRDAQSWLPFPTMWVHGGAGWVTECQKLHTNNSSLQTGKWGRVSPSGLVSVNLSCQGSVTLIGKCWHPWWNRALKSVPDNYEAAVSPGFLGMLFVTPLTAYCFFKSGPPGSKKLSLLQFPKYKQLQWFRRYKTSPAARTHGSCQPCFKLAKLKQISPVTYNLVFTWNMNRISLNSLFTMYPS